jgi:hypothetical protein
VGGGSPGYSLSVPEIRRRFGSVDRSGGRRVTPSRSGDCVVGGSSPSVRSGATSVERSESAAPCELTKEEQLIDLADRPTDGVDRDTAHEGGQGGRLVWSQAAAHEHAIRRAGDELGRLVGDPGLCGRCRPSRCRGSRRPTRGRRREEACRGGVARRSPASPRTSLCRPVHVSCGPSTLVSRPVSPVRYGHARIGPDR